MVFVRGRTQFVLKKQLKLWDTQLQDKGQDEQPRSNLVASELPHTSYDCLQNRNMSNTLLANFAFHSNNGSVCNPAADLAHKKVARLAVKLSAGLSLLQSGLIFLFAVINVDGFRGALAGPYILAYAIATYFTSRMSRIAATASLLIYLTMRQGNCEALHVAFFLMACSVYVAGIWGTVKLRGARRSYT